MIKYIDGDIFSSPAQVLVNTVNTVGVMGKGIALEFKKRYPKMFEQYKVQCDKHKLVIGKLMLWYGEDYWVLQFPTKEHWRNPSKLEYIEQGLMTFVRKYADYNISSIAFPKLGCGNGDLDWNLVRPLMEKYLNDLPIDVYVYLSNNIGQTPEHKEQEKMSEFLKAHAKDLSYTGIKDEIKFNTMITPIQFCNNGKLWSVHLDGEENIIYDSSSETHRVLDKTAHMLWDKISQSKIYRCEENEGERLFCGLLEYMGYIQAIKLQQADDMVDAYQLVEGKGRIFMVRGYDDV